MLTSLGETSRNRTFGYKLGLGFLTLFIFYLYLDLSMWCLNISK